MQCRWHERPITVEQFRSNLIQIPVNLLEKPIEEKNLYFKEVDPETLAWQSGLPWKTAGNEMLGVW
jgi:hypothetical protein